MLPLSARLSLYEVLFHLLRLHCYCVRVLSTAYCFHLLILPKDCPERETQNKFIKRKYNNIITKAQ